VLRHLDTIDELEAQANEEKRLRIEKWRIEQSQALLEEVEKETRRRSRRPSVHPSELEASVDDIFGTTPKQSDYTPPTQSKSRSQSTKLDDEPESEPFWRRITRKFIRDIIGIDDPLLSVILGESLPGEETPRATSPAPESQRAAQKDERDDPTPDTHWRDRLLQRIARELGVIPSQLTPHPGAFTTFPHYTPDYAGMPVSSPQRPPKMEPSVTPETAPSFASSLGPNFPPTLRDDAHAESWGYEEEPPSSIVNSSLDLRREREYWERELDLKMVFRYLRDRFTSQHTDPYQHTQTFHKDNSAHRAAIIRQHHPLVNRPHRSPARMRRESRISARRPTSSCASESLKGSRKASALRSGSSRNYWDIGGSVGSGSVIANGGVWGHA